MYAVIKTGGKQYKVAAGEKIKVEQIAADVGQEIVLDQVLAVGSGTDLKVGTPWVSGASGKAKAAFAAPYPGTIIPMTLKNFGGTMICQKDSFLAAAKGVQIGLFNHAKRLRGVQIGLVNHAEDGVLPWTAIINMGFGDEPEQNHGDDYAKRRGVPKQL
mgnify:CR=1 FL=1